MMNEQNQQANISVSPFVLNDLRQAVEQIQYQSISLKLQAEILYEFANELANRIYKLTIDSEEKDETKSTK